MGNRETVTERCSWRKDVRLGVLATLKTRAFAGNVKWVYALQLPPAENL